MATEFQNDLKLWNLFKAFDGLGADGATVRDRHLFNRISCTQLEAMFIDTKFTVTEETKSFAEENSWGARRLSSLKT